MSSVATIQLVSSDLSHQETILQIVDALDHLDKITNQVFSKIQTKIDENAAKLTNLDQRVDLADLKVKKLSEMKNKATCIYSSAKYPEENNLKNYTSAFKNMDGSFKSQNEVKIVDVVKGLDIKEIKEKRRYFHLPVKKKPTTLEILDDHVDLRTPEKTTGSALSYLVFNTAENAYSKMNKTDWINPLNQKSKSKKDDESEDSPDLAEAPASLGFSSEGLADQGLFFAPALGDLPDLDLPDILDLPNLPTDLTYMTDLGPGIAPSIQNFPEFSTGGIDDIPEEAAALLMSAPPAPPPAEFLPPPPPPAAPMAAAAPPILQAPPAPTSEVLNLSAPSNLNNLPLVPPPAFENSSDTTTTTKVVTQPQDAPDVAVEVSAQKNAPENSDNGRAGLMAAIRNAGGSGKAGLKSVMEQKMEEKKAKQEEHVNPAASGSKSGTGGGGGDLMSDLASKLAMRRKGISGNQAGGSTMDKISMMIPSLPDEPDEEEADEDNSSEDDWNS